jgi:hypothetical protein
VGNKRDSILQILPEGRPVPDLGAPKVEYVIVEFTDCEPSEFALGVRVNGEAGGYLTDGAGRLLTSRSKGVLRQEAANRGIPAYQPPAGISTD